MTNPYDKVAKWDTVSVRVDKWKRLQALCEQLEPHEHYDGMNECHICDEPLTDVLIRHLETLSTAQAQNICDACAGTGKPVSGLPCMCGGTGRMSDAAVHLREQLVDAKAQIATLEVKRREDVRKCAGQSAQHWYHKYEAAESHLAQIEAALQDIIHADAKGESGGYMGRIARSALTKSEATQDQAAPKGQAKEIEETGSHATGPADAVVPIIKCSRCGEDATAADGCRDPLCPADYEQGQADMDAATAVQVPSIELMARESIRRTMDFYDKAGVKIEGNPSFCIQAASDIEAEYQAMLAAASQDEVKK